jgi:tetratricopeptide (TPR) repeat protein
MDSLITAAARALSTGNPLNALNYIALRDDPPALALRGIAMAQLGDLARAKLLLRRAASTFGPREAVARARCAVAQAEIALVSRDLNWPAKRLDSASDALERHGDRANATHARYLKTRYFLLIGRLDEAERLLEGFNLSALPPASQAAHELVAAGIAMRRLRIKAARESLRRAERAARQARIPALVAEVEGAALVLNTPTARLVARGQERLLRLDDIETLLASKAALIVDACRHVVCHAGKVISLERRPVLFALARALAEAWPGDISRATLLSRAFRARHADESHRARLRVEIGRLRKALSAAADIDATKGGFALVPLRARDVAVLAPPTDEAHATVLALLADGEAWPTSALALAVGASQRTVRALEALTANGKVQAIGAGRARRWMAPPVPGFPTTLLLPATLPGG